MHVLFSVLQGALQTAYQSAVREAVRCFDIRVKREKEFIV